MSIVKIHKLGNGLPKGGMIQRSPALKKGENNLKKWEESTEQRDIFLK